MRGFYQEPFEKGWFELQQFYFSVLGGPLLQGLGGEMNTNDSHRAWAGHRFPKKFKLSSERAHCPSLHGEKPGCRSVTFRLG